MRFSAGSSTALRLANAQGHQFSYSRNEISSFRHKPEPWRALKGRVTLIAPSQAPKPAACGPKGGKRAPLLPLRKGHWLEAMHLGDTSATIESVNLMAKTITRKIETSHCTIATEMTTGNGLDVVLIHGNSSCRAVFERQLHSGLGETHRLICFDLPGHGQSGDARQKERTYPLPGLADAALEVLEALDIRNPVLVGWSLGGHIAIEMVSRQHDFRGLFITGTPPVGVDISEGFCGSLLKGLAASSSFSQEQALQFTDRVFGSSATPELVKAAARTDGDFRATLFSEARIAEKSNQREVVSSTKTLTAVVNGAADSIVNLDYVDHVPYANLWRHRCFRIAFAGHAPSLQNSAVFNHYLAEFLSDVESAQ